MKKLLSVMAFLLMAAVVAFPPAAHATLILSLDDGVALPTIITDQLPGDTNPTLGVVSWSGAIGVWDINVSTGFSKPVLGIPGINAAMDLNSIDHSTGAGTLTIMLTDTDFTIPGAITPAIMGIGGTTDGNVSYSAYFDNTNVPFGVTGVIGSLGPLVDAPFSFGAGLQNDITTTNPFSLTQVVTINHDAAGLTSFNAKLNVPVPATALLLGTGLLGLVGLRYRSRRKS
ncbi:MAG: hypothetical protein A3K23_06500 [Desulfobacca sp. RBG_16_58_9]|nr:MAG: hypothetical protein A3K23_06500 [Desulfobacca sp. RBG_16_58_9]